MEYRDYEKIINQVLNKYNLYYRKDEFIDICYIGVAKALKNYNFRRKTKLNTYIFTCIKNEVINEIKKQNVAKRKGELVHIENIENIGGKEDTEEILSERLRNNELYSKIFKLDIYEQYVVYNYYIKEKTIKEISNHVGIRQNIISGYLKSGINNLKEMYGEDYL